MHDPSVPPSVETWTPPIAPDAKESQTPKRGSRFAARRRPLPATGLDNYMNSWRRKSVGALKIILPLIALIIVMSVVGWTQLRTMEEESISWDYTILEGNDDNLLGLAEARLYGHDQRGQPFTITAASATHADANIDNVDLMDLQADITLSSGAWLTMSAPEGIFVRPDQVLMLDGDINIFSDRGYEFFTEAALMDLSAGIATSETPIRGQGPFGVITADRFRAGDMGKHLFFNGNVEATLYPAAGNVPPASSSALSSEGNSQ